MLGGLGFITSAFYVFSLKEPYLAEEAKRLQKEYLAKTKITEVKILEEEDKDTKTVKSSRMSTQIGRWYDWLKQG